VIPITPGSTLEADLTADAVDQSRNLSYDQLREQVKLWYEEMAALTHLTAAEILEAANAAHASIEVITQCEGHGRRDYRVAHMEMPTGFWNQPGDAAVDNQPTYTEHSIADEVRILRALSARFYTASRAREELARPSHPLRSINDMGRRWTEIADPTRWPRDTHDHISDAMAYAMSPESRVTLEQTRDLNAQCAALQFRINPNNPEDQALARQAEQMLNDQLRPIVDQMEQDAFYGVRPHVNAHSPSLTFQRLMESIRHAWSGDEPSQPNLGAVNQAVRQVNRTRYRFENMLYDQGISNVCSGFEGRANTLESRTQERNGNKLSVEQRTALRALRDDFTRDNPPTWRRLRDLIDCHDFAPRAVSHVMRHFGMYPDSSITGEFEGSAVLRSEEPAPEPEPEPEDTDTMGEDSDDGIGMGEAETWFREARDTES
jgi:hypothetical protein